MNSAEGERAREKRKGEASGQKQPDLARAPAAAAASASAAPCSAGARRPRSGLSRRSSPSSRTRHEEGSSSRAPCSAGARRPRSVLGRRSLSRGARPRSGLGRRREAVAAPAGAPRRNLRLLLRDAAEDDEAVPASALKCLGFALYHPVLVSTISGQLAQSVLATLVRLIMTTKMKAICNLAVWCISVQQLEASVVEDGVTPLLNAIVYALDNPFGSLSTTFEAVQDLIDGVLLLKDVNRKSYRWMFTVRIARIWEYMSTDPIEFYSSIHWHTS